VVGPNGSGKSNIADAIRWSMGEQSVKLLRGKKSEDVIFSGSSKRARSGFAEVSLYLNNEDRAAEIDYTEVVLTRRLYRDGQAEYFINKNKTRLQDIQLLLAQANFGPRTYSVIGQGMIDHFLVATPQERKEFFDEAAGVKQYQIKRQSALNKLENSRDNLNQALLVMGEIEPRLRSLSRLAKRLERRDEVEKELKEMQDKYYGTL
jgi:chromosome segregation protein